MKKRQEKSSSSNNEETNPSSSSSSPKSSSLDGKLKRNASLEKKDLLRKKTSPANDRSKLYLIPLTLILAVSTSWGYNRYLASLVNTPLNVAKVINDSSYKSPDNIDRFWGTYR